MGTACLPDIIVEMYSRECNVHFRTIGASRSFFVPLTFVLD
jgi:hypothetical protein